MAELVEKADLAWALGINVRTVERWVHQGCPHERDPDDGVLLFDRDAVHAWNVEQRRSRAVGGAVGPRAETPMTGASARENLHKAKLARQIASARQAELDVQQDRSLRDLPLGNRIRAARTLEDLADLTTEVLALVGESSIRPVRANALHKLITERRQQIAKLQEKQRSNPLAGPVLLCTADAEEVVRAFEALVSDERREQARALLTRLLEEDLAEFPAPIAPDDEGRAARPSEVSA